MIAPDPQAAAAAIGWDVPVVDLLVGLALLLAAAGTLLPRSRQAQAAGFLVLGAVASLMWLRLGSVDVALAEAGLGGGVLGALLVWLAAAGPARTDGEQQLDMPDGEQLLDGAARRRTRRPWIRIVVGTLTGGLLALVFAGAWVRAESTLPSWGGAVDGFLPETGVSHDVTGVLLAFRAYDTLLESAVLMLAGIAVLALARGRLSRPVPALPENLSWAARLLAPLLLLAGLWLLFAGSSGPGGAFQSGALLCAAAILTHAAGLPMRRLLERWVRPLLVTGVIAFALAGLVGPLTGEPWLSWDPAWAFVAILTVEVLLTAGIAAGLLTVYLGLRGPDGERSATASAEQEEAA